MKKYILVISLLLMVRTNWAQKKNTPLLGVCAAAELSNEPHASWYLSNFTNYNPNIQVIDQLKKLNHKKFTYRIVFGSWCGDSKRELPRMMKIFSAMGLSEKSIELIGVYDSLAVYKQSPNREEKGLHIYRVPTLIVYQNEKEAGRIVEFPVETLERDLLKIVSGNGYTANYKGYPQINSWLMNGVLTDVNMSPRGLAEQIRSSISRESELNACGYVIMGQGDLKAAISIFRININLFPQSSNCFDSLGEAYLLDGQIENSKACYKRAIELDPKNENAIDQLTKLTGKAE
jgi:tetratricopeptide (TPR) repeat protein